MGIAWTKPRYGINVMWQLFSCSVVERFNIDNLFQRWNLENPCVFRTFFCLLKIERLERHPLSGFGLACESRDCQLMSQRNSLPCGVQSPPGAQLVKCPMFACETMLGCSRENWDLGQKGMVSFNIERGTFIWISCLNTGPVYEMPFKSWQTSHGYIDLKLS